MNHISIDLETMASSPDAAIATIGVAVHDFVDFDIQPWTLYRSVNDPGGRYDPATIRWHKDQTEGDTLGSQEKATMLRDGLVALSHFLRTNGAHREGEARIYAHATFDFPVLHMAYLRCGLKPPWYYRNTRDLRTMYDHHGSRPEVVNPSKHNAVADALCQLREVAIMKIGRDPWK